MKSLKCYIIGDSGLTLQAIELLLKNGHHVLGVISTHPGIQKWARLNNIFHSESVSSLKDVNTSYDYLFSIVNHQILPVDVLKQPTCFAINYHDSLLPSYGGIHSTSWAILNNESHHGVTWHKMTERVDAGDILKQAVIPLSADETALSLNLKCYEQAILTFEELIRELADESYIQTPQALTKRSFYGRYSKPPRNGLIDWDAPAEDIDRLVRALFFDNQPNAFSSPKWVLNNEFFIIQKLVVTSTPSTKKPGTLVEINSQFIQIATRTTDVRITEMCCMDGKSCAMTDVALEKNTTCLSPEKIKQIEEQSRLYAKNERYWINQFNNLNPLLFPFFSAAQHYNPQQQNNIIAEIIIPPEFIEFSHSQYEGHLSTVLFSVLLTYFYRVIGKEKISIHLSHGFLVKEVDSLSSFFSTSVPFTIELHDKLSIQEVLIKTTKQCQALQKEHTYSKDIFFRYPECKHLKDILPITVTMETELSCIAPMENILNFIISSDGKRISIHLNRDVTHPELKTLLQSIPQQILVLLKSLMDQPEREIAYLSLLTEEEKHTLLVDWNATESPFPHDKTIHALFEEQVSRTPKETAVVFHNRSMSYSELNIKANQLAAYLKTLGLQKGDRVILCLDRDLFITESLLGVLKAGGVYVPIEPHYPAERIKDIIEDSTPFAFIAQSFVYEKISSKLEIQKSTHVVLIDQLDHQTDSNLNVDVAPNDLAYIIYTSGSTNKPKGVLVPHRGVVNCLTAIRESLSITNKEVFLALTSLAFDVAVLDYYLPLSLGAKMVIADNQTKKDAKLLIELIKQSVISVIQATPGTFEMLRMLQWVSPSDIKFLVAGEAFPPTLADYLIKNGTVFNIYGPTETSIYATLSPVKNTSITIGKPLANLTAYILDKNLQLLPIGYEGELHIGGVGVADGYLNRPELTNEKFIKNIFSSNDSERFYKTGDLARWLPNGEIEYLGRIDHQVKIRGFRIELGEIEHALLRHSQISQVIVLPHRAAAGHLQLICFVVPKKEFLANPSLNANALQTFLQDILPEYMIPAAFIALAEFPLNSNGKINRQELLTHINETIPSNIEYKVAESTVEKQLLSIWQENLGLSTIGISDDFFALGGDSIIAMQIIAKANDNYGLSFTVEDIFKYPTIEGLSKIIRHVEINDAQEEEVDDIPLTPIQQWFLEQSWSEPSRWSQLCLIKSKNKLETTCLQKAISYLLSHHDAFSLRFEKIEHEWKQNYIKEAQPHFIFECHAVASKTDTKKLVNELSQSIQARFDLKNGPLVGAVVLQNEKTDQLLIVVHHLLIDGVSWRIFLSQLTTVYQQLLTEQPLPKLSSMASFRKWAKSLKDIASASQFVSEQEYWMNATQKTLPVLKEKPDGENIEKLTVSVQTQLNEEMTRLLLGPIHSGYHKNINDVLLGVLLKVFSNWMNHDTVLFDVESHGRQTHVTHLNCANTVGWFTSIFPVSLTLIGKNWNEIIFSVKQQLQNVPHQGIGYGLLRYLSSDLSLRNALRKQPQPQICFNYWGQFERSFDDKIFQWDSVRLLPGPENHRTHLINVDCVISEGKFTILFSYSKECFSSATIEKLANNYRDFLNDFINYYLENSSLDMLHDSVPLQISTEDQEKIIAKNHFQIDSYYPLTPLQQGLIFQYMCNPVADSYQIQMNWEINQAIDLDIFKKSIQMLIDLHPILRTSFDWEGLEEPIQIVHRRGELNWSVHDWSHLNDKAQQIQWKELLISDQKNPIDLTAIPLFRIIIVKLSAVRFKVIWHSHHILLDGWSFAVLLNQLSIYYQSLCNHQAANLSLQPPSFSEYVKWMNQQDWAEPKLFWQNYLKEFTEPTDINIASALPTSHCVSGAFVKIDLNLEESKKIRRFAQSNRVTLSTLFQGLWGVLLHHYAQSNDVVFGVTVSGRSIPLTEMETRVGLYINTLPLRIRFTEDMTIENCLVQTQKSFSETIPFSHTPFTYIQSWSELQDSHHPLFDSIVVFENYPKINRDSSLMRCERLEFWDPTHYALTFMILPGKKITLKIGYDVSRVTLGSANRLLNHLQLLLTQIIDDSKKMVKELVLLSPQEFQEITEEKIIPYPDKTISQLFEERVTQASDQLAVVDGDKQITYAELNKRANQLASYLKQLDVKLETPVACCFPRNLDGIVSLLAVWKAGGVYVPLDPSHPVERLKLMLKNCGVMIILTHRSIFNEIFSKEVMPLKQQFIFVEEMDEIKNLSEKNLELSQKNSQLAYILYTSGTTGEPKGIAQEHKTLVNLLQWQTRSSPAKAHRKISQIASMNFDVALQEITYALCNGYELHLVSSIAKQSLTELLTFFEKNQIHQTFLPTAMLEPFCEAGLFVRLPLSHLTDIFVAGEALKITPSIKKFFAAYPQLRLTNQYGPTETHVVSAYPLFGDPESWPAFPSIGYPIDNIKLYVLDKKLHPVPQGIPGELYISGTGLARHYVNDPKKTSQQFISHSFGEEKNVRLYKTGDKVKWEADDRLTFLGRLDQQIKIHGFRIEPAEIEEKILTLLKVRQCVVVAKPDLTHTLQLICYFVSEKNAEQDTKMFKKILEDFLPEYMIPAHFIQLKYFQLTQNGKIDKKVLPDPLWNFSSIGAHGSPRHVYDQELMQLWIKTLGIRHCHIHDDFFSLGGNSLKVLRLLLLIEKQFHVPLSVNDFLLSPTIATLSDKIQYLQANKLLTHYSMVTYRHEQIPFPITPLRSEGHKTPLFLIHPVGGTIFWFVDLARYFNDERPIYGIQDPSVMAGKRFFDSIEEMASFYLHCIRQIQPHGPYYIAGASFGSTVAFEIAKQLDANNEEAAFVGLLDGWSFYPTALQEKEKFQKLMRAQCESLHQRFQVNQLENVDQWIDLQWHRNNLLWKYSLVPQDFQLTLFKAQGVLPELAWADHPYNYWNDYSLKSIDLHSVPGDHETMFQEPHVKFLAERINNCLKKLEKQSVVLEVET